MCIKTIREISEGVWEVTDYHFCKSAIETQRFDSNNLLVYSVERMENPEECYNKLMKDIDSGKFSKVKYYE